MLVNQGVSLTEIRTELSDDSAFPAYRKKQIVGHPIQPTRVSIMIVRLLGAIIPLVFLPPGYPDNVRPGSG